MDFKEFMAAKYPDIEPSGIVYLAIKAAWNACKEEAAKVAEGQIKKSHDIYLNRLLYGIAKAIREL